MTTNGDVKKISHVFARNKMGNINVSDGITNYGLSYYGEIKPIYIRVGLFETNCIKSEADIIKNAAINGRYYAYITYIIL